MFINRRGWDKGVLLIPVGLNQIQLIVFQRTAPQIWSLTNCWCLGVNGLPDNGLGKLPDVCPLLLREDPPLFRCLEARCLAD